MLAARPDDDDDDDKQISSNSCKDKNTYNILIYKSFISI